MAGVLTATSLKGYLGIGGTSRDAKVGLLVAGLNEFIESYTNRDWESKTRTDERYPGPGGRVLVLKHYPVASLTTLTEDGATIDVTLSTEVELDSEQGIIYRTGRDWVKTLERIYLVTYEGGATPPDDLKMATLEMGAYLWRTSGGRQEYKTGPVMTKLFFDAMTLLPGVKDALHSHIDTSGNMIRYSP